MNQEMGGNLADWQIMLLLANSWNDEVDFILVLLREPKAKGWEEGGRRGRSRSILSLVITCIHFLVY